MIDRFPMNMVFDFRDTEGRWTPEKRQRATEQIRQLCREDGISSEPTMSFDEPEKLPGSDEYFYCYSAEILEPPE